ncbi:MAG: Gfo/Idh/MocA family oxidoreductase [Spirochaetales bacterium]|nr:Gfo/Idh/MocA family oxidoreductase [Spirochaetales bacterium]
MTERVRFVIVGSGWRSLYYARIAKALPERFELCAMLCRTEEKAQRIAMEYGIHTTVSEDECMACRPDLVVIAVTKKDVASVAMKWLERGFCVLSETPAALDMPALEKLWKMHLAGGKLVVCEQYRNYPVYGALISLAGSGIIGDPYCLNISLAHEYHGASLMRALLNLNEQESFTVRAKNYTFPTVETLSRYEEFHDGRIARKTRTAATFEFANGKTAFYDFDSDQYRSPIRRNYVKVRGERGEIENSTVRYLDGTFHAAESIMDIREREVVTQYGNPNLHCIREVQDIVFEGRSLYTPPFGLCGLAQDETAMAIMMQGAAAYGKGNAPSPYPLEYALQDAYTGMLLLQAAETGKEVASGPCVWTSETR